MAHDALFDASLRIMGLVNPDGGTSTRIDILFGDRSVGKQMYVELNSTADGVCALLIPPKQRGCHSSFSIKANGADLAQRFRSLAAAIDDHLATSKKVV